MIITFILKGNTLCWILPNILTEPTNKIVIQKINNDQNYTEGTVSIILFS